MTRQGDLIKLLRSLRKRGFKIERTKNNHLRIRFKGRIISVVPVSHSNPRQIANLKADIKRATNDK